MLSSKFTQSTSGAFDQVFTVWHKLVYAFYPESAGAAANHECSSLCLVSTGPCQLFYSSGGVCYLGRWDHEDGIPELSEQPTSARFYYVTDQLGEIVHEHFCSTNVTRSAVLSLPYFKGIKPFQLSSATYLRNF